MPVMEADGKRGLACWLPGQSCSNPQSGSFEEAFKRHFVQRGGGRIQRNARHDSRAVAPLHPEGQGEGAVIRIQMRELYGKGLLEPPAEAPSLSQVPNRE